MDQVPTAANLLGFMEIKFLWSELFVSKLFLRFRWLWGRRYVALLSFSNLGAADCLGAVR